MIDYDDSSNFVPIAQGDNSALPSDYPQWNGNDMPDQFHRSPLQPHAYQRPSLAYPDAEQLLNMLDEHGYETVSQLALVPPMHDSNTSAPASPPRALHTYAVAPTLPPTNHSTPRSPRSLKVRAHKEDTDNMLPPRAEPLYTIGTLDNGARAQETSSSDSAPYPEASAEPANQSASLSFFGGAPYQYIPPTGCEEAKHAQHSLLNTLMVHGKQTSDFKAALQVAVKPLQEKGDFPDQSISDALIAAMPLENDLSLESLLSQAANYQNSSGTTDPLYYGVAVYQDNSALRPTSDHHMLVSVAGQVPTRFIGIMTTPDADRSKQTFRPLISASGQDLAEPQQLFTATEAVPSTAGAIRSTTEDAMPAATVSADAILAGLQSDVPQGNASTTAQAPVATLPSLVVKPKRKGSTRTLKQTKTRSKKRPETRNSTSTYTSRTAPSRGHIDIPKEEWEGIPGDVLLERLENGQILPDAVYGELALGLATVAPNKRLSKAMGMSCGTTVWNCRIKPALEALAVRRDTTYLAVKAELDAERQKNLLRIGTTTQDHTTHHAGLKQAALTNPQRIAKSSKKTRAAATKALPRPRSRNFAVAAADLVAEQDPPQQGTSTTLAMPSTVQEQNSTKPNTETGVDLSNELPHVALPRYKLRRRKAADPSGNNLEGGLAELGLSTVDEDTEMSDVEEVPKVDKSSRRRPSRR